MLEEARKRDQLDPLAACRNEFDIPANCVYLDGNSLGALPKAARKRAAEVVEQQWGRDLITSWNKHAWINLPQQCGARIAPLLGAKPSQVICCDSISVNLFKVLCGALAMQPGRTKIVTTADNFPTDVYIVQGIHQLLGEQRCQLITVNESDIESALNDDVAILLLTQVNFRTGHLLDMARITHAAHQHGILTVWDLAHSAGVIPIELARWQVDFAIGCTYKYLNGGPGAPAFMYVAERHSNAFIQPITGWMGHATPFTFSGGYTPHESVTQSLAGTPPVISMSVLHAALEMWSNIDIQHVRDKSIALGEFMLLCLAHLHLTDELQLASPLNPAQRGSQLAFQHEHAYAICQAWIAEGVIADFRAPNILRVGFAPLYIGYEEVWLACEKLQHIIQQRRYLEPEFQTKHAVT
ncbi:kynureninase [Aestuariibacter sp. GS-14]|uniref:kynureninase n=2 Tax=Alteromonadaceae TaxID=72275 RepID=UPI00112C8980|nr:kynureninase [Aestuariibacter sp. GS-14]TPV59928.1 kynureninase [Aestuariibacter sp. GS-14]